MKEIEQLTQGAQRVDQLVRRLGEHTDHLEPIEIDLLLQELRNMYSTALMLTPAVTAEPVSETVSEAQPEIEAEVVTETETFTPVAPHHVMAPEDEADDPEVPAQPLMDPQEQSDNEMLFEEESATEPDPLSAIEFEPLAEAEPEATIDASIAEPEPAAEPKQPEAPQPVEAPTPQKKEEKETQQASPRQSSLFDYIHSGNQKPEPTGSETLGDRLGRTGNEMRGETAQHKRVSDLRTVININDKFSFMKDLFQNNMKAYNDFIIQLNGIEDRTTAQRRVDEVAQIYNWDKNSLTVKTFYNIFDRKF